MAEAIDSIIDEVLVLMGLDTTSPSFVSRVNVLRKINNWQKDMTENTYAYQKRDTTSVTFVTSQRAYDLPSDTYDILKVSYDDDNGEEDIWPIDVDTLSRLSSDWMDAEGTVYYYWRGGMDGMDKISFYKLPDSDYNGESPILQIRYYPSDLTDASDDYLNAPCHSSRDLVVDYCLSQLLKIRKATRDVDEADKALLRYLAKRRKWEGLEEASGKTIIYGSRRREVKGPLGPTWPENYPG